MTDEEVGELWKDLRPQGNIRPIFVDLCIDLIRKLVEEAAARDCEITHDVLYENCDAQDLHRAHVLDRFGIDPASFEVKT